ncbi:hypothetical protein VE02_01928 [Pseudogymnoascus sp. 03VT05]|nr:hypothetical protein VE02_01928 [Pseudogymnoascus sp. 03VT05]
MAPLLNFPVAQLRRRIELLHPRRLFPPQPIRRRHFKYVFAVFAVVAIVLLMKITSFLTTAHLYCAERGGLMCWNTATRVTDFDVLGINEGGGVGGRDIPMNCEAGVAECRKIVDGVCVSRSCPEVDVVGEQNTTPPPPTEELSGTPTVDKASAWWWSAQRAQESGAACTGAACNPEDDGKSAVKRQFIGSKFPVGWMAGQHGLSSTPPPPAMTTTVRPQIEATGTTGKHVNGTPTGEIPLVTNVGESGGEARGVGGWNYCAASAALLGLVAVGVVVLL